jgi:hypothetical protein
MFSVIFEVHPREGKKDEYLGLATHLKPILEAIDGFVDNGSKANEGLDGCFHIRPGATKSLLSAGGPKLNITPCRKKDGMRYSKTTASA